MFLLKYLNTILMLSSLTLTPRIKTNHSRALVEVMYWMVPRARKPNLASGLEDLNPSYPYLPTVLEEPGSSLSEAAEDDPLPVIEGLRITGDAFPGRELQASGYPTNGNTSCNFEWVRHLEDGFVNFIEGARQPSYVVTADDMDTLLAIEVQPLDDRKRKVPGSVIWRWIRLFVPEDAVAVAAL